ncbi:hypothetical protein NQ315_005076 [Exocentrus adspersus]|uniref:Uncharacterized protein n=1 Tax=Exocentrus adspersus TaxID=1586481 RepID=A0AAV8VQ26_9CUCU|nr:hypothetical protein NQ315_005076 [Exocentrus adspersus]
MHPKPEIASKLPFFANVISCNNFQKLKSHLLYSVFIFSVKTDADRRVAVYVNPSLTRESKIRQRSAERGASAALCNGPNTCFDSVLRVRSSARLCMLQPVAVVSSDSSGADDPRRDLVSTESENANWQCKHVCATIPTTLATAASPAEEPNRTY